LFLASPPPPPVLIFWWLKQLISGMKCAQDRAALTSCLRTLGIFVMFPCYLTDTAFHIDVADAILPHLQPPTDKVKKKKVQWRFELNHSIAAWRRNQIVWMQDPDSTFHFYAIPD
jgi:hypothetical protein